MTDRDLLSQMGRFIESARGRQVEVQLGDLRRLVALAEQAERYEKVLKWAARDASSVESVRYYARAALDREAQESEGRSTGDRKCPKCNGDGCQKCAGTGQRFHTHRPAQELAQELVAVNSYLDAALESLEEKTEQAEVLRAALEDVQARAVSYSEDPASDCRAIANVAEAALRDGQESEGQQGTVWSDTLERYLTPEEYAETAEGHEAQESEGQASLSRLGEFAEKHRGGTITLQADGLSELVALAEQAEALREAGQELRGYVRAQLHGHDATVELAYAAEKWDEALREAQESEGREG